MAQRLELLLQDKGFVVTLAGNGREALDKIARDKPHLVLTDIEMPQMNGLELIRHLRKDGTTAFIPVIILSQKSQVADRLKGFAVGTDDYLPKPFSFQEMFFRINVILRRVYNK
jgi:two-component system response regulator MprA